MDGQPQYRLMRDVNLNYTPRSLLPAMEAGQPFVPVLLPAAVPAQARPAPAPAPAAAATAKSDDPPNGGVKPPRRSTRQSRPPDRYGAV